MSDDNYYKSVIAAVSEVGEVWRGGTWSMSSRCEALAARTSAEDAAMMARAASSIISSKFRLSSASCSIT